MKEVLGLALAGIVFTAFLKSARPEWGTVLSLALAAAVLFLSLPYLRSVTEMTRALSERVGEGLLSPLFRAVGAAILLELGVNACKDAGESALSHQVEFFGKLLLLTMAIPVMRALIELVVSLADGI